MDSVLSGSHPLNRLGQPPSQMKTYENNLLTLDDPVYFHQIQPWSQATGQTGPSGLELLWGHV